MDVLGHVVDAVKPGGLVLDLQVIRPNPTIEVGGQVVDEIDGEPLFRSADAAVAAIDALVHNGRLVEQASDDHDVRKHYVSGLELVDDFGQATTAARPDNAPLARTRAALCRTRTLPPPPPRTAVEVPTNRDRSTSCPRDRCHTRLSSVGNQRHSWTPQRTLE